MPSLDERREDIPALLAHFSAGQSRPLQFTEEAIRALRQRPWPGNVRQLRNLVDQVAVFVDESPVSAPAVLSLVDSPSHAPLERIARKLLVDPSIPDKLDAIERALISEAMSAAGGNKTQAARLLGVHRKVVERRMSATPED